MVFNRYTSLYMKVGPPTLIYQTEAWDLRALGFFSRSTSFMYESQAYRFLYTKLRPTILHFTFHLCFLFTPILTNRGWGSILRIWVSFGSLKEGALTGDKMVLGK